MRVHIRVHFCLGVKKDNVLPLQEDCTDVSAGRGTQDNSATLEVLILVHNPSKRYPFLLYAVKSLIAHYFYV